MRKCGELINGPGGGAGLVVDYGGDRAYGDSFRVCLLWFFGGSMEAEMCDPGGLAEFYVPAEIDHEAEADEIGVQEP